ncbi:uncharacterized protein ColSpa_07725 [Colletotrichum spaethianum]|uniref:Uncharacterized protein n=1 Tax=Colletotrichum spaethianum TaxID=700344 RepID=A0AA37P8E4_9PEZI|nr:uncharacterized protein ColSpa_07725 [Colletotrichum spaethianum]GKT47544.1 hypothetical protein ColSpa_07725 [Colletotrichum spaethianum]
MSTETFTQKAMMSAGLSGPHNYHYQQHHLYNPAPRLSALVQAKQAKSSSRRSPTVARQHARQRQPQPLHPLTTMVAVVFDYFLRGVLDLTRPPRELVSLIVRCVFTSLNWAYHALPMPLAVGMFYYGFQSVPDGLRSVEELRVIYSSKLDGGAIAASAFGIEGLYGLGELALVRWGDLGVLSAFYCLSMMTAAYAVMVLIEMRDYILDTWALIVNEALEVKALLRADEA